MTCFSMTHIFSCFFFFFWIICTDYEFKSTPSGPYGQYLAAALGRALQCALADICEKRPSDPIEHLAWYLKKYALNAQEAKMVRLKNFIKYPT